MNFKPMPEPTEKQKALFFLKIDRSKDCWEWTAAKNSGGYGLFGLHPKGTFATHRIAYALHYGSINEGMLVCHHCDNPPCCNPDHLFLGTGYENAMDKCKKGRHRGNRKLTGDQILEIYNEDHKGNRKQLAEKYGVDLTVIGQIMTGRTHSRLTGHVYQRKNKKK